MSAAPAHASPHLQTLAATPGIIATMLEAATPAQLTWKPALERWSIAEVLAHLADVEVKVLGHRVGRMAREDSPSLVSYDQNEQYALGTYSNADGRANLAAFTDERCKSLEWLRQLRPGDWQHAGRHPEVGEIRIAQLMNLWAFHDLGHIRQIAEVYRAAAYWDGIGSLQRYYSVHP